LRLARRLPAAELVRALLAERGAALARRLEALSPEA